MFSLLISPAHVRNRHIFYMLILFSVALLYHPLYKISVKKQKNLQEFYAIHDIIDNKAKSTVF